MALIKCPECGMENVSSMATSCPRCGFPIKEHHDLYVAKQETFSGSKYCDVATGVADMFFGNISGSLGEVSALLLLIGGLYLILSRVITWHIPVAYLGTVALLTFCFAGDAPNLTFMLMELCAGGLVLGAFFMATDYVTSPVTPLGRIIYGVICGALTVFIRFFGANPEGVSYAILIANLFVWYIDKYTKPRRFGGKTK